MTPAEIWIREHLPAAPTDLLETMVRALPEEPSDRIPEALAIGAMALYAQVASGPGDREDALPLLAADALFTHAFQAQAEVHLTGVETFAQEWGGRGRLSEIATE